MRFNVSTHKPNPTLWLVALIFFIYALLPLPYSSVAMLVSALLLLLGTTVI